MIAESHKAASFCKSLLSLESQESDESDDDDDDDDALITRGPKETPPGPNLIKPRGRHRRGRKKHPWPWKVPWGVPPLFSIILGVVSGIRVGPDGKETPKGKETNRTERVKRKGGLGEREAKKQADTEASRQQGAEQGQKADQENKARPKEQ